VSGEAATRDWSGPLALLTATPPETEIDYVAIFSPAIYLFPKAEGLYPLKRFNQIILYWGLWAMPATATHVQITPIAFRSFLDTQAPLFNVGALAHGQQKFEWYEFQVITGTAPATTVPLNFRKTAADPTLAYNGQTYHRATRYMLPISEDYIGFLVEHDGTSPSGLMTLAASVTRD
jgi:hypothetical protein